MPEVFNIVLVAVIAENARDAICWVFIKCDYSPAPMLLILCCQSYTTV